MLQRYALVRKTRNKVMQARQPPVDRPYRRRVQTRWHALDKVCLVKRVIDHKNRLPAFVFIGDSDALTKTYSFEHYGAAIAFAVHVGFAAEKRDHHPEMHISWGKVEVPLDDARRGRYLDPRRRDGKAGRPRLPTLNAAERRRRRALERGFRHMPCCALWGERRTRQAAASGVSADAERSMGERANLIDALRINVIRCQ
jgi:pterin-4a-carbinolamine dehydratase